MLMPTSQRTSHGFTIVELLIVIVVIGILAAITIVAYNGVQNRASDTAVQSDLRQIASKMEEFKVNSADENYPKTTEDMESLKFSATKNAYLLAPTIDLNLAYCKDDTAKKYAVVARSKSGKAYSASEGSVKLLTNTDVSNCGLITGLSRLVSGYWYDGSTTKPWRTWAGGN